jgi:CRISPR-associated endonuclease/helicase Cas3
MRVALDAWFADAFRDAPPLPAAPGFQHALAGLLMLADWLGSDTTFFPFADGRCPDRMAYARERASLALSAVGLNAEPGRALVRSARLDFTRTFGLSAAHPIQLETALHDAPVLVLEAETGSGKTEAALWRFAHLFVQGKVDGLYFALPTRVAASQIYNRLRKFRDGLFGDVGPPVVRAVPGQAGADGADGHRLPDFGFEWSDDPDEGERRARWAAEHPKRFLAAQLAAGTLDQALLGAITVKHAHLRGAALLRHLLVVDEVHASDTYMAGLLDALLRGQVAAGGQALLLSATLGAAARSRLLGTQVPNLAEAERVAYPALSWTETGVERQLKVASDGRCKHVLLDCTALLDHPAGIAQLALDAARQGARVLVVRNTVGGAIAVQRALEAAAGPDNPVLFRVAHVATLHHGRFAPADRRLLDAAVETVLGKDSAGGGKIVVGTQTLEQSLDIDADLLLTDLCPADVLLQRIGRLHRHAKRIRPNGFADPRTLVLVPGDRDLLTFARRGRHGLGAFVYEDLRVIEATWRLAEAHTEWVIPQMNRMLVERATHPEVLEKLWVELAAQDPAWRRHLEKVDGERRQHGLEAGLAAFDRTAPFSDFEVAEERCATRLGTADRQVAFAPAPGGPFATPVDLLRIPHQWLAETKPDDVPESVAWADGVLSFRLGRVDFRYDRLGLRRA